MMPFSQTAHVNHLYTKEAPSGVGLRGHRSRALSEENAPASQSITSTIATPAGSADSTMATFTSTAALSSSSSSDPSTTSTPAPSESTAASSSSSSSDPSTTTSTPAPTTPIAPTTPTVQTLSTSGPGSGFRFGGAGFGGGGFGGGGIGGIGGLGRLLGQALSGPLSSSSGQGTTGQGGQSGTTTPSQLQTDLQKLRTDLQAINDKSQVTPALIAAVRTDVQTIQKDATSKPDQTKVTTLENDVKALNGQLPTDTQKTQLETDFTAVIQSEGVTDQTLISQTISAIEAVVKATNITSADLATIAADRKAIQTNLGSSGTGTTTSDDPAGADFLNGLLGGGPQGGLVDQSGLAQGGGNQGGHWGGGFPGRPLGGGSQRGPSRGRFSGS
jgi:hypothetical protein